MFNINFHRLDNLQNQALRFITAELISTPSKALPLKLESKAIKRMIVRAREKAPTSADDHSKQTVLQKNVQQRLDTHSSFRHKATDLSSILLEELNNRTIIIFSHLFHG